MLKQLLFFLFTALPAVLPAQSYYYHSINANTLSASFGQTYKVQYMHQLSHGRQLRISGNYISDNFDEGTDRIQAKTYNFNVQFQYNLVNFDRLFINGNIGFGAYYLEAVNKIDIKIDEKQFNFIYGAQVEYYLQRNSIALVADVDVLYMGWSDLYKFLRSPSIGLAFYF